MNIAGIIYSKEVITVIRKLISSKYGEKCDDLELQKSLSRIMEEKINPLLIKVYKSSKTERKTRRQAKNEIVVIPSSEDITKVDDRLSTQMN